MSFEHFHNICFETLQVAVKGLPLEEVIVDILKGKWDHERTKFSLPPLMTLVRILKFTISCKLYVFAMSIWFYVMLVDIIWTDKLTSEMPLSLVSSNTQLDMNGVCLFQFFTFIPPNWTCMLAFWTCHLPMLSFLGLFPVSHEIKFPAFIRLFPH